MNLEAIRRGAPATPQPVDDPPLRLGRMVVLVGLMGAGKSAVGKRLAQRLNVPFIDTDAEIEKAAGESIAEIFEHAGEAAFRSGERRVIARLLRGPVGVLATGGGAFMHPETRQAVREHGLSIWLKADLDTLVSRTARRKTRPLLNQGSPRETLARLMEQRHPFYAEADLVVESQVGSVELTVQAAIDALASLVGPDGMVGRPTRSAADHE